MSNRPHLNEIRWNGNVLFSFLIPFAQQHHVVVEVLAFLHGILLRPF